MLHQKAGHRTVSEPGTTSLKRLVIQEPSTQDIRLIRSNVCSVRSPVIDGGQQLKLLNGSYRKIELKFAELVEWRVWAVSLRNKVAT